MTTSSSSTSDDLDPTTHSWLHLCPWPCSQAFRLNHISTLGHSLSLLTFGHDSASPHLTSCLADLSSHLDISLAASPSSLPLCPCHSWPLPCHSPLSLASLNDKNIKETQRWKWEIEVGNHHLFAPPCPCDSEMEEGEGHSCNERDREKE